MRSSPNERLLTSERRCILSGERGSRDALIRLALGPDGAVAPDVRARAPGRGAWIGVDRAALETAMAKGKFKGALARAFKAQPVGIPDDLAERVESELRANALNRLGMEARAGLLVTGSDRIEETARRGQLSLLLHAADAGEDGNRRLDQAWRVGSEAEGSGERGTVLAVDREALSRALGRENVVHIGITDARAAARVADAIARWHGFIGRDVAALPCGIGRQGSSARSAGQIEGSSG